MTDKAGDDSPRPKSDQEKEPGIAAIGTIPQDDQKENESQGKEGPAPAADEPPRDDPDAAPIVVDDIEAGVAVAPLESRPLEPQDKPESTKHKRFEMI